MAFGTSVVLLVAPDDSVRRTLTGLARGLRLQIAIAETYSLSRFFDQTPPALVIIGPAVAHAWDILHLTRLIRQWAAGVPIMIVTSKGSEDLAVAAMRAGVNDYFTSPLQPNDLARGARRLLGEPVDDERYGCIQSGAAGRHTPLIGTSPAASSIRTAIAKIANTDSNALITGETGTGKELAARLIHAGSRRSGRVFVSIDCAAIPETLLESELFGYERGAFTGAASAHAGRVLAAHRGTAFFDEIGDLSPVAQAKMLRLVEEKEVPRLGTSGSIRVDARIVAATNRNLEALMSGGGFRSDLYFRLNVARIHLSPLRERREDIPLLLTHYLELLTRRLRRGVTAFTERALAALTQYDWPGNIRELKNAVERSIINAGSRPIDLDDVPDEIRRTSPATVSAIPTERIRLFSALATAKWNKSAAARELGWSRMTLYRKLDKYQSDDASSGARCAVSTVRT